MDLLYLTETIAYNSIRNPIYDRYESTQWKRTYTQEKAMKVAESESHRSGDGCKLCKEKQKRSLSSYIRNKSVEHSTKSGILEEEEEEECKK